MKNGKRMIQVIGAAGFLGSLLTALVFLLAEWGASARAERIGTGAAIHAGFIVCVSLLLFVILRIGGAHWAGRKAIVWMSLWHGMLLLTVGVGGILGMILYSFGGLILPLEASWRGLLVAGARDGAFYFLIWAPGGALVACVMLAAKERKERGYLRQT